MSVFVGLGAFRLRHRLSSLQAKVHTSTELQPASDRLADIGCQASVLERLQAMELWIVRHRSFLLEVRIHGGPPQHGDAAIECFRQAKLWKLLNLNIGSSEILIAGDETSLLFNVEHLENEAKPPRKRPHKLPIDESESDLRPPPGIVALKASRVLLEIQLSLSGHDATSETDTLDDTDLLTLRARMDGQDEDGDDEVLVLGDALTYRHPEDDQELLLDARFPDELWEDFNDETGRGTARPEKRTTHLQIAEQAIIAILDAALRFALIRKPKRLHAGIRVEDDRRLATLQDIAPAIWSPGYLNAMAERACFVSMINRAILKLPSQTSRSPHVVDQELYEELLVDSDWRRKEALIHIPSGLPKSNDIWEMLHHHSRTTAADISMPRLELVKPSNDDLSCQRDFDNTTMLHTEHARCAICLPMTETSGCSFSETLSHKMIEEANFLCELHQDLMLFSTASGSSPLLEPQTQRPEHVPDHLLPVDRALDGDDDDLLPDFYEARFTDSDDEMLLSSQGSATTDGSAQYDSYQGSDPTATICSSSLLDWSSNYCNTTSYT